MFAAEHACSSLPGHLWLATQEEPAEVTDAEALPLLLAAMRAQGSTLAAALKLPAEAAALQRRACWLRAFCAQQLQEAAAAPDQAAGAERGTAVDPAVLEPVQRERTLCRGAGLPDLSDAALLPTLESWAAPSLAGARSLADAQSVDWLTVLRCWLHFGLLNACTYLHPSLSLASSHHE